MGWSPCTKHNWLYTDRAGIYRCSKCWVIGYAIPIPSQIGWTAPKTYNCPRCKGVTPAKKEICPRCLPDHPLHKEIGDYDPGFVEYISLKEKCREVLRHLQCLGVGPHRLDKSAGIGNVGAALRTLNQAGFVRKVQGDRRNRWSLTEKALRYLREEDGSQRTQDDGLRPCGEGAGGRGD